MSNPPVPFPLKVLRGNPGKRRLRPEPQPERGSECPDPPPFVIGHASDEWWRIAPELHRLGLLTVIDIAPLATYCMAYHHWRTAEETLAAMAERDPATHALLIRGADGNVRANPLTTVAARAAETMLRVASEFGMTAVARARLAAGIGGQPRGGGKFDGLLA